MGKYDPQSPTRADLARVFKDQRTLRAFEQVFKVVPTNLIDLQHQVDAIGLSADQAVAAANAALSTNTELARVQQQILATQAAQARTLATLTDEVALLALAPIP